jgi:hypothetical protein
MNGSEASDPHVIPPVSNNPEDQSGGINILGGVNTFGGDVVGRDQYNNTPKSPLSDEEIKRLFSPLLEAIRQAAPAQQEQAAPKVQDLKEEVSKGKHAEDARIAKLVDGIIGLVPGAVGALTGMFVNPILSGIVGPATRFVLDKIQGK